MKLGTKIIIGFFCISFLLAFIGFISDRFTSNVRQEQIKYVNEASSVVIYTGEMESNLYQSLIFLNAIRESMAVESGNNTLQEFPSVVELKVDFEEELNKFEDSYDRLSRILNNADELPGNLSKFLKSYLVYKSIADEWLILGMEDYEQANLMFINSIEPYFRNNIIPQIAELRAFVLNIQERRNQELNDSLRQAENANSVATILSILLAIVLAVYIYRSIANPLIKLNKLVTKIGEGNLHERIEVKSKDELGELAGAFNKMAENLELKTVSKEYVDNIIESIHEAIFVSDIDDKLIRFNSAATCLIGYNEDELIHKPLYKFMDLDEAKIKKGKDQASYEFNLIHKNGNQIPVLYSEANLTDTQGDVIGIVSVASDISKQKNMEKQLRSSLKEKEVMLAEIHHRVKNNLAVISGLLQLQSYNTENEEVKKALTDSQLRIQSIALVHEMLYENETLAYIQYDNYINDLLQAISSMYIMDEQNIQLISDVEPIKLTINQAIPCSLLLNELVVNAFKHAFKEGESGKIIVSLSQQDDEITLLISDTGSGFNADEFEQSNSLGSTLIRTLASQLKGIFEILPQKEDQKSRFKVTFKREI